MKTNEILLGEAQLSSEVVGLSKCRAWCAEDLVEAPKEGMVERQCSDI